MKSGIRKGILSDESVLINCSDQQSIPLNKLHLAPRSSTGKISRPQKASYMYQNLPLPQSQKEELISDFVLRSQKAKPLVIPARQYSTLSLDKPNALVTQVATQPGGGLARDVAAALTNAMTQTNSDATTQTERPTSPMSVSQLTSAPGTPDPDEPLLADLDSEAGTDEDEGLGGTGLLVPRDLYTPGGTSSSGYEKYTPHHTRRGTIFNDRSPIVDPMASAPPATPTRTPSNILGIRSANDDPNVPLTFTPVARQSSVNDRTRRSMLE